ncbi:MAG: 3-deoxy-manno-octulosonate cytidylyltransferase [Planctomycetota bacterium]|nr:MAG: 3-deoxy-manno-octulosonate cytidylyltransferase [Planctomycetota bacterium]
MGEAGTQPRAPHPDLRALAILPARIGSTRLPRKMLLAETGTPLFVHTAVNVARAASIERVVVATDSPEIVAAGETAGLEVVLTRVDHASGTDRCLEAYEILGGRADQAWDVIVNVQGDEPTLDTGDLDRLVAAFADPEVRAATLCGAVASEQEARAPSVVKVVRDGRGNALYFSRAPIPARSHARGGEAGLDVVLRHIGVYAFRPDALAQFCALPASRLEEVENLEQLRWLEAGMSMRVLTARRVPRGIDTRADYEKFVAHCAAGESMESSETR